MNAGKAVYGILSANSGVTDIVGTRIFPEIAEQEAITPFVIYQLQSVAPEDTHDGPSKLDEVRFEFLCYADSYNAAADLGVAVRAALDRVSGTYNGVHVESVQFNDVDVEIEYDPRRYSQVLKFTFRIKRDDVTIALGTPVTGAVLGDLSDVDVTGVTNGQLIAYNSTSGNWEAANDAGGANELSDLSDANVSLPSDGEVLIYSGGEFVNDNIAISNVTGLQAALDAAPDNLRELTDVTISGLADNDYLQYDSASGTWQNSSLILGRNGEQYTGNYDSEAETLLDGATETVELYYTAQADGDGLHEDAQTDTATAGYDIRRKLYYAEKAQADPNTSGDWTQFADIADDTTYASAKATLLAYLKARTGGTVPISLKMTWEEVAEAPTFTGLLNESYGSGAAAAYSVRRLNGLYTGSAIQVERSSDNTTQDIGFDSNGDLDESALTTFCTGTVCKVRTWYDQSVTGGTGSGNDAVQTTHANQPTIYTGGAIVKENGRVAMDLDDGDGFTASSMIAASSDKFAFLIHSADPTDTSWSLYAQNAVGAVLPLAESGSTSTTLFSSQYVSMSLYKDSVSANPSGTTRDDLYNLYTSAGQSLSTTDFAGVGVQILFNRGGGRNYTGTAQELIFYASDKSTDRTSIESNIGDYFTQNTPLLDTYTGAAAAYSLRKLRTAYTGSAIRVRRASDNTEQDIGFNVFGELDTVSLASFCSGTNGFVKTWYDQSGNANDATQTTAANQPKIYDSSTGVVKNSNGNVSIYSDDTTTYRSMTSSVSGINTTFTHFAVIEPSTIKASRDAVYRVNATIDLYGNGRIYEGSGVLDTTVSPAFTTGNLYVHSLDRKSSEVILYGNGSQIGQESGAAPSNTYSSIRFLSSGNSTTNTFNGYVSELVFYTSSQTANRTNIEDNINTFYSIY